MKARKVIVSIFIVAAALGAGVVLGKKGCPPDPVPAGQPAPTVPPPVKAAPVLAPAPAPVVVPPVVEAKSEGRPL